VLTLQNDMLIVGGDEALKNEYIYQIAIRRFDQFQCGGSILSTNYIVTSAQCVIQGTMDSYTVVAGDHNLNENDFTEQIRSVSGIVIHPNFTENNPFVNDIALVRLSSRLQFNSVIGNINMAPQGHLASGFAIASGWGSIEEGDGILSDVLRKVTLDVVSDDSCAASYGAQFRGENMICAGRPDGGADSCDGDAGGPLMCFETGSRYLCGVTSWGNGCGRPNFPGVYTEISYYSDWIYENSRE